MILFEVLPILLLLLAILLGLGLWIGLTLIAIGAVGLVLKGVVSFDALLVTSAWSSTANFPLTALPLFIWMGEILFRSNLSKDLFQGLSAIMSRLPGGLIHLNIYSCGIFAAVTGSSAATVATIGKINLPELQKRGYNRAMSIGSLASSATLGLLIPPSIVLIIYGVVAEVSIARLYIAGIVPGLMLLLIFSAYICIWSLRNQSSNQQVKEPIRLADLLRLLPICLLIVTVIGSIFLGLATPTESAALGVCGALIIQYFRTKNNKVFITSLFGAVRTTSMLGLILIGAQYLTLAIGFLGVPQFLVSLVESWQLQPWQIIVVLTIIFLIMGCFIDGISIVIISAAIFIPLIVESGFDLIWFGIYLVLVVELSQITPPIGFNLFVSQSLTQINILTIAKYCLPFFGLILVAMTLIYLFPQIVLLLPQMIY